MRNNPWNPRKVAAVIDSRSADETREAFPKVFHYGNYSYLSFDHGTVKVKKTDESSRGIDQPLLKETVAVDISALKTLPDVMDSAWRAKRSFTWARPMTGSPTT